MEKQRRVGRTAAELTFWTLCPYCYYAHEYEKAYEECCLRCANCRRGFHAAAIRAPPEATALDGGGGVEHDGAGGGGYYDCRMGLLPLRYVAREERGEKEEVEERIDVRDYLVEISSDEDVWESEAGAGGGNVGNGGGGKETKKTGKMEESWGGELEFEYEGDDILVSAA